MELLEKYTYTVCILGSFSAAAKELFISQPALSAAVSRHEKNLGFTVFDRSVLPLSLTPEGKIYVEYLEEKEKRENEMHMRIRMLSDVSYGTISVGAYALSANKMLSRICGEFYKEHPNVKVRLDLGSIGKLENLGEKMKNHSLDMMIHYDFDSSDCVGFPILKEKMIIAMHKDLPGAEEISHLSVSRNKILRSELSDDDYVCDVSAFKDITFFEYAPFSNTKYKMKQIIGEYKTANYVIENARQVNMHNKLMKQKIGAVMTTDFHIASEDFNDENLLFFAPKSPFSTRTLYIITPKGVPQSSAAKEFLELAIRMCN